MMLVLHMELLTKHKKRWKLLTTYSRSLAKLERLCGFNTKNWLSQSSKKKKQNSENYFASSKYVDCLYVVNFCFNHEFIFNFLIQNKS